MASRPLAVDLFAGAGGLSLGLEQAGFEVAAAVEIDRHHAATHRRNFPDCPVIEAPIEKVPVETILTSAPSLAQGIDLVAGGPPCQGFSVQGRRDAADPRNRLLEEFAKKIVALRPRTFVIENVPGLLSPQYVAAVRRAIRRLDRAGYSINEPAILDAADFGVPQRRRRVFIVGSLQGSLPDLSELPRLTKRTTVWDALSDLPNVDLHPELDKEDAYTGPLGTPSSYAKSLRADSGAPLTGCLRPTHSDAVRARFEATSPGGREPISRFERLDKQGVSGTLRAGTTLERGKYMAPRPIHPVHPRCITVREAARLHSYPDRFEFDPTRWHGFMQVGNSVPPKLAEVVGSALLAAL